MMTPAAQIAGLALLAIGLLAAGAWILKQRRDTPEKRECKRRLMVNSRGRLADGIVTDVGPGVIYYSYAVGGVEYRASQDVAQLAEFLPPDPDRLVGPATLKYFPRNPANSILVCESWSGLWTFHKETIYK